MKTSFSGYWIVGWHFFSFNILTTSSFMVSTVSDGKSAITGIISSVPYVLIRHFFSSSFQYFLFSSGFQQFNYDISIWVLFVFSSLGFAEFESIDYFTLNLESLLPLFLHIFFNSSSLSPPLVLSLCACVSIYCFLAGLWGSLDVFPSFSLYSSRCINSIDLYSNSFILFLPCQICYWAHWVNF